MFLLAAIGIRAVSIGYSSLLLLFLLAVIDIPTVSIGFSRTPCVSIGSHRYPNLFDWLSSVLMLHYGGTYYCYLAAYHPILGSLCPCYCSFFSPLYFVP